MFEEKISAVPAKNEGRFSLKDKFSDTSFKISDIIAIQQRVETLGFFAYRGDGKSSRIFTNIHLRNGMTVCSTLPMFDLAARVPELLENKFLPVTIDINGGKIVTVKTVSDFVKKHPYSVMHST